VLERIPLYRPGILLIDGKKRPARLPVIHGLAPVVDAERDPSELFGVLRPLNEDISR